MTFPNHLSSSKLAWSMLINLYLLSRALEKGVLSHLLEQQQGTGPPSPGARHSGAASALVCFSLCLLHPGGKWSSGMGAIRVGGSRWWKQRG